MNTAYVVPGEVRARLCCMEGFCEETQEWTEIRRGGTMDWARRVEEQPRHGKAGRKKGSLFLLSLTQREADARDCGDGRSQEVTRIGPPW